MFARPSCSLSIFLIVFMWLGGLGTGSGTALDRECGRRGVQAQRESAAVHHAAAQPGRPTRRQIWAANPDPGFMFRLRAKARMKCKRSSARACEIDLCLIDIALFPVASALRLCALTFQHAATGKINCTARPTG